MTTLSVQSNSHPLTGKSSGSHRILVVDDEPAILFAYRKLIEKDGIAVDISTNLIDALRLIAAYQYLAVIADLRLAGTDNGDGLEILRFIQRERPGIKSILATGYGNSEVEHTARTLGVSYCFNKPVQPADILAAIQEFRTDVTTSPIVQPS